MAESEDKTEEGSEKKLRDALEEGNTPRQLSSIG